MPNSAPIYKNTVKKSKVLGGRPSAYHRGYGGRRWNIIRHKIFIRDNYMCQGCGNLTILNCRDANRRPQCDHIIIKKQGGTDEDSNLQTLCGSCHSVKTWRERYL